MILEFGIINIYVVSVLYMYCFVKGCLHLQKYDRVLENELWEVYYEGCFFT